jgi:hypothetical protein
MLSGHAQATSIQHSINAHCSFPVGTEPVEMRTSICLRANRLVNLHTRVPLYVFAGYPQEIASANKPPIPTVAIFA